MDDAKESDREPIQAVPKGAEDDLGFPEIQGDLAPSAVVPKACACITKHTSKVDGALATLKKADSLTPLQNRTVWLICLFHLLFHFIYPLVLQITKH